MRVIQMPADAAVFVKTHTHKAQDSGHEAVHFEACEDVFPSKALHFDTEMHASISHAHMLGPCAGGVTSALRCRGTVSVKSPFCCFRIWVIGTAGRVSSR